MTTSTPAARPALGAEPQSVRALGVSRRFGNVSAVADVTLEVPPGAFVALVGPSGCGKTTLLRLLGGLDGADAGRIERAGGTSLGVVFQEPRLLGWRSVRQNVALPLELAGVPRRERLARADEAIELARLSEASSRLPHQLSGGMKMRAALARALVARPSLLLLDEPFGALDEVTRHELDAELRALWERERLTSVLVTHSVPEAVYLAERVVVFSPRPARIVADVPTPGSPRNERFWTSPELGACARAASDALLAGISEARR